MNKKLANDSLGRPSIEEFKNLPHHPIILVLDDVRSLANVGSLFRTSDGFNIERVVLCGITGTPPHRDIQRTALGSTESVEWSFEKDIISYLKQQKSSGYSIISVEQCESSIRPEAIENTVFPCCLVLGNEVEGIKQDVIDISDIVVEIPQEGTKHSLNVTIAGGIVLWELFKRISGK